MQLTPGTHLMPWLCILKSETTWKISFFKYYSYLLHDAVDPGNALDALALQLEVAAVILVFGPVDTLGLHRDLDIYRA